MSDNSKVNINNFYDEYAATIEKDVVHKQGDSTTYLFFKRMFDLLLSILLLPIAIILIIIFSLIIKIESRGPAFFTQTRVGINGGYFKLYKLRSMHNSAEKNGAMWAKENDPRVTRVGKFIRIARIDELPQLFNVIKGDMSIVGPRPERPIFTAEFEERYPGFTRRLKVKPGLTGWAQVNGGYEITPEEKLDLDLQYIKNRSTILDLKIMVKTIRVILTGDGAR